MNDWSRLPLEAWGRRALAAADAWAEPSAWRRGLLEFLWFGLKQAWACLFGGAMLGFILLTFLLWPDDSPVSRYDFLVVGAALI